jgi:hypothetical protein
MKHSVYYDRLPDIFLAFDLYDRASKAFMSREFLQRRLEESAAKCCCSAANAIKQVPLVAAFASPTDLLTAKSVKQVLQSPLQRLFALVFCLLWTYFMPIALI